MSQPVYFKSNNIQVYPSVKRSPTFDYLANRFSEQSIRQLIIDLSLAEQQSYIPWHYSPEVVNLMAPDPNVFDLSVDSSTDTLTIHGKVVIQGYMIEMLDYNINVSAIKLSTAKHYIYLTLNVQNIGVPLNASNQSISNTLSGYDQIFDEYIEDQEVTQATFSSNTYYKLENGIYIQADTFESGVTYYIKRSPKYTGVELNISKVLPNINANTCILGEIQWVNNSYSVTTYKTTYIADTMSIKLPATSGLLMTETDGESLTEWLNNNFIVDDGEI